MEYFVEYYPNDDDGEQAQELNLSDFMGLIRDHQERGLDVQFEFDNFTIFDNGRDGQRLTIKDEYGIFYG